MTMIASVGIPNRTSGAVTLQAVVYHEAGHAVAAWVRNLPVVTVTVMPQSTPGQRGFCS